MKSEQFSQMKDTNKDKRFKYEGKTIAVYFLMVNKQKLNYSMARRSQAK